MIEKLEVVEIRYRQLTEALMNPELTGDRDEYRKVTKEHAEIEPIVNCYIEWKRITADISESKKILEESCDEELRELAKEELDPLVKKQEEIHQELMILLLPKDPNDDKNIILEIRAGTGGDESSLFAAELFTMYCRYAESLRWKVEVLSSSDGSAGGFKEVISRVEGQGAYSLFKYESGVHRVQRVPKTETQGRVHTSTVTVAVLPEAEEVELEIADKDIRIDVYRSSGPGGQSVNTTDSAVRVTHLPTGMIVTCQDEKSQLKNKNKALGVLRSRLLDMKKKEQDAERSQDRKSQIGTGERSEKIRTYNFPQSRITDHRIGFTSHQIDTVMGGKLDILVEPLRTFFRAEALKGDQD